jgi:MYXO-CTERM domain-containing protein
VLLDHYLGYQAGCTPANGWCNAPERFYEEAGCRASPGRPGWLTPLVGLALIALVRRRSRATLAALTLLPALAGAPVHAAAPDQNGDALPTPAELAALREVLRPGPWVGFVAALGASVDRTALAGSLGVRFRASPKWLLGLDVEWNPWFTTSPARMRSGALNLQAILIRRYQLRLSRIALRTTLRLGMSVLLFDLYGAPQGSVGPYVGLAPLGVEVALGSGWRVVIDPIDWELPVPHVTGAPLYYPQYRLLVSLQFGG